MRTLCYLLVVLVFSGCGDTPEKAVPVGGIPSLASAEGGKAISPATMSMPDEAELEKIRHKRVEEYMEELARTERIKKAVDRVTHREEIDGLQDKIHRQEVDAAIKDGDHREAMAKMDGDHREAMAKRDGDFRVLENDLKHYAEDVDELKRELKHRQKPGLIVQYIEKPVPVARDYRAYLNDRYGFDTRFYHNVDETSPLNRSGAYSYGW